MRLGGRALVGLIGDFFLEHASAARAEYLRLAVRGSDMAVLIRGDVAFANDRAFFGVLMRALVSGQAPLGDDVADVRRVVASPAEHSILRQEHVVRLYRRHVLLHGFFADHRVAIVAIEICAARARGPVGIGVDRFRSAAVEPHLYDLRMRVLARIGRDLGLHGHPAINAHAVHLIVCREPFHALDGQRFVHPALAAALAMDDGARLVARHVVHFIVGLVGEISHHVSEHRIVHEHRQIMRADAFRAAVLANIPIPEIVHLVVRINFRLGFQIGAAGRAVPRHFARDRTLVDPGVDGFVLVDRLADHSDRVLVLVLTGLRAALGARAVLAEGMILLDGLYEDLLFFAQNLLAVRAYTAHDLVLTARVLGL